jgi:hypothetical protein
MFSLTEAEAAASRVAFNEGGKETCVIAPDAQRRDHWVRPAVMVLSAIVSIVVVASLGALALTACQR